MQALRTDQNLIAIFLWSSSLLQIKMQYDSLIGENNDCRVVSLLFTSHENELVSDLASPFHRNIE